MVKIRKLGKTVLQLLTATNLLSPSPSSSYTDLLWQCLHKA